MRRHNPGVVEETDDDQLYYERCAGIDVHKDPIVICVRKGRTLKTQEFGTTTNEIRRAAKWLQKEGCMMSAMESTGVYWKPIYNVFEEESIPIMVCNAQHVKNVPGRKTDKNDARWLAKCLSRGLLNPSYIPDRRQREMRDATRFRKSLIDDRARTLNRIQKLLEGANIKLSNYISDIHGTSATALLKLVMNKPDFTVEDVKDRMCANLKSSAEELYEALTGCISPLQRSLFELVMDYETVQTDYINKMTTLIKANQTEEEKQAVTALQAIPGIGERTADTIVSEVGSNVKQFRNQHAFSRWIGVAPGNNESGGKRKHGKTTFGNKTLKSALTQSAQTARKVKDSFFSAQYSRLVAHLGKCRTSMAIAHSLAIAIYFVLSGQEFKDLGADYYNQFNRDKKINSHIKQLSRLGVAIEVLPKPPD